MAISIQTSHLQAELIIDDIQFSGKAYLRAIAVQDKYKTFEDSRVLNQEADELLHDARTIALQQQKIYAICQPNGKSFAGYL